jgi:hypothetical protein
VLYGARDLRVHGHRVLDLSVTAGKRPPTEDEMGNKAMKAMMAAGGLPALDNAEAWGRIGAWWRDHGENEADLKERISELEADAEEHEEQTRAVLEEAKAARESVAETLQAHETSLRELEATRRDNAALRKVIDKFTMSVPAVVVGQALRLIETHCEQVVPGEGWHMSHGRLGADEQKWHPIMRAILNETRRALAAIEAGK